MYQENIEVITPDTLPTSTQRSKRNNELSNEVTSSYNAAHNVFTLFSQDKKHTNVHIHM